MGATLPLLVAVLATAGGPLAGTVPAEVASGLATAVAQDDHQARLAQAELIVSGHLNGDLRAARGALEHAAQIGDGRAAYTLGALAYHTTPRDFASALRWWRMAAQAGHAEAQYSLGLLLADDLEHPAEADAAFEAAAAQQHVLACFALGTRLATRDERTARRWLQCAAAQGYAPAQYNLATLLARAATDNEELAAARRWYAAAAATFAPAASALAALPASAALHKLEERGPAVLSLRDQTWVMAQPETAYTVQIASGASAETLVALLQNQIHDVDAACVRERPTSRQPYSAIVGVYADRASANRALGDLPAALRANQPWIRRFGTLQRALREAANSEQSRTDDAPAVSN